MATPAELIARLPGRVRNALITLRATGASAHLVGGAVRDLLAARPSRDFDLATDADESTIRDAFPGCAPHGPFGTFRIADDVEVTRLRVDGAYRDGRRPENVRFGGSLADDLARRDFTINALALGYAAKAKEPALVDPCKGAADLAARRLRAVGDPDARFGEDTLRILRGYRLAGALDLTIEKKTRAAMAAHASKLAAVSNARIGIELLRALRSADPLRIITELSSDGALGHVLPNLTPSAPTLAAVAKLPGHDPELRLAALLVGVDPVVRDAVLVRLDCSRAERTRLAGLTDPLPPKLTPAAARDRVARIGRSEAERLIRLLRALPGGTTPAKLLESVIGDGSAIGRGELALPADEIATLSGLSGREFGELLAALVSIVHADPALNEPRQLRSLLRSLTA